MEEAKGEMGKEKISYKQAILLADGFEEIVHIQADLEIKSFKTLHS